jgi:hypothetical protein
LTEVGALQGVINILGYRRSDGKVVHMRKFTKTLEDALRALFPLRLPVAEATVTECKQWAEEMFSLTLDQMRIITRPKPALNGMLSVQLV